jgi:hypothetical protein
MILSAIKTLTLLKEKSPLHGTQEILLSKLDMLKNDLEETWLLGGNNEECSMWDWLENEL